MDPYKINGYQLDMFIIWYNPTVILDSHRGGARVFIKGVRTECVHATLGRMLVCQKGGVGRGPPQENFTCSRSERLIMTQSGRF